MRKSKITFVGPVRYQGTKTKRGNLGAEFYILQDGGALKLEYSSMEEALAATRALLADHHSHSVPSNKLLSAIQQALEHDHGDPPQEPEAASQGQDNNVL